jgi:CheY-like chemotaxis protein
MTNPNIKSAHVLLVEDNEGDIILTKEAFEESGGDVEISVVRNGQEAFDFIYQRGVYTEVNTPDLILLDINIPVYSGHQVLQKIKNDSVLKKTPVIMLTTSRNQKDIELAYENHCNSYLVKPVDFDHFLRLVKSISEFWLELSRSANI